MLPDASKSLWKGFLLSIGYQRHSRVTHLRDGTNMKSAIAAPIFHVWYSLSVLQSALSFCCSCEHIGISDDCVFYSPGAAFCRHAVMKPGDSGLKHHLSIWVINRRWNTVRSGLLMVLKFFFQRELTFIVAFYLAIFFLSGISVVARELLC